MAKNTLLDYGPREIRICQSLVPGGQIIRMATLIVSDWRLEEMIRKIDEIARGMIAGADHIIDAVISHIAATLQTLPITSRR